MDRMAKRTKQPEVLGELFEALGNDPFVIAECLARPILADRLFRQQALGIEGEDGAPNRRDSPADKTALSIVAPYQIETAYKMPQILVSWGCVDDTWSPTSAVNVPNARVFHTAIWTGSEMIVWGGWNAGRLNTGARYIAATDSWMATSVNKAPDARDYHTAIWTGSEMIVWGGEGNGNPREVNTGGRYNPMNDNWASVSTASAPVPRAQHTAAWTGAEMIVWGGRDDTTWFNSGGRYDPGTDTWTATTTLNAPERRWYHTVEWSGSQMIVWGGTNQTIGLNTGGKYDPATNSWTATGTTNAPLGRFAHTSIWSGNEMDVWGGVDSTFNDCNTGGRYNPTADSWTAISTVNAPSPRDAHTAVWNGTEMIIWGGEFGSPAVSLDTGGRYVPGTDSWTATSIANVPHARDSHTAVWVGSRMIVWGGGYWDNNHILLNTGGRYCAQSEATPTPTPTATATTTPTATATATLTPTSTPASPTPTATAAATATPTPTATSTPGPTPTPRSTPAVRPRPTPPPRP